MAYATLDDLRGFVSLGANVSQSDPLLTLGLEAAEEWVDNYCARNFTAPADDAVATVRYFEKETSNCRLSLPDIADDDVVVEHSADRATWATIASSSYFLTPDSAEADGIPWDGFELLTGSLSRFVRVTAVWGWPGGVPASVKEATLLRAVWFYKRKDSPYGIEGFDGTPIYVSRYGDSTVFDLLAAYRRGSASVLIV